MPHPPLSPASAADLEAMRSQLGRPMRGVVGIAARCVCGNPTVVATEPRLPDGTPFPTFYYLTHPGATAAMSALEANQVMPELAALLADDEDVAAAYLAAHEAYLSDRAVYGDVPEIAGISAGGMPTRVKCLHALAGHALAAGAGVNPIGDLALARAEWSPERCTCAPPAERGVSARRRRVVAVVAAVLIALGGQLAAGAASTHPVVAAGAGDPAPAALTAAAAPLTTAPPPGTGDPARAAEYWLDAYGVRQAWQTTRGKGVTIAVIDTGIGRSPVEFSGAVVGGADFSGAGSSDGRTPVGAVDANHGSWVASLAAARGTGADTGMIGVAPEANLLSLSIGFGAASSVPFVQQVADAMKWAVDHGADIINLSFTTNTLTWDPSWDDAFQYAFDHDVVVVVAAGNKGSGTEEVGAPATIPGVLTVGGVNRAGTASEQASTQGITIGISAPSEQLLGVSADGQLVVWDGTSGAAPIVAGIAALVRSAHPDLDADNVINRIIKTARPAAAATKVPDEKYGYGLIDANAAVSASVASVDSNPMGSLSDWIRLYRRADAVPQPTPTSSPVTIEQLPAAETLDRRSPLLPSVDTLLYGTVPLGGVTLTAILVALGVTAAARRIRSERAPRTPSR